MTQRGGRDSHQSTVSNDADLGRSSMADDNLITEPRNHGEDHNDYETVTPRSPAAETGINPKLAGSEDRRGGVMWVKI